jgi:hypothetical protein
MGNEVMKLWILENKHDLPDGDDPWEPWCDKMFSIVVRAETESEAREIAACAGGNEVSRPFAGSPGDFKAWTDPKYSTCLELTANGEPGEIIQNYHAA